MAGRDEMPGMFWLWVIHIVLGTGLLTPWNSYLTSMDFWTFIFDDSISDAFAIANFIPNFLLLVLQLRFLQGNLVPKAVAGLVSYAVVISFAVWLIVIVQVHDAGWKAQQPYYAAAMIASVALAGGACAILQGALYSFSGQLPPSLVGGLMTGSALAGVLCCVCRVISKLVFQKLEPEAALRWSSLVYMSSSLFVVAASLICLFLLVRHPIVKHHMATSATHKHGSPPPINDDEETATSTGDLVPHPHLRAGHERGGGGGGEDLLQDLVPHPHLRAGHERGGGGEAEEGGVWDEAEALVIKAREEEVARLRDVVRGAGWWAVGGCSVFALTLAVFPGMSVARTQSQYPDPGQWFGLVLVCVFNAGDFLGRFAAGHAPNSLSVRGLLCLSAARLLLVPLWLVLSSSASSFGIYHDVTAYLAMFVLSASNGFLASIAIMRAPGEFTDVALKENTSTVLVLALTMGLALGSLLAVPLSYVSLPPLM